MTLEPAQQLPPHLHDAGPGHSWVGVFLGWLGEQLFGVMKFRELDFLAVSSFPHVCCSCCHGHEVGASH